MTLMRPTWSIKRIRPKPAEMNSLTAHLQRLLRKDDMATNSRESRRRKILDRGADRLAFITGRTQDLQSESLGKSDSDSSLPLNSHIHRQGPPPHLSDQISASPNGDDGGLSSILPNNDSVTDSGHGRDDIEPSLRTLKTSIETLRTPASNVGSIEQLSWSSSTDQRSTIPSSGRMQHLEQLHPNISVASSQINSAIAATESSRLFCSVMIALLVVLSYLGFPLLGSNVVRSMLSFRPLYLVLLSNVTLVLARLLFNTQRGSDRIVREENFIPSTSKYDWAERAGNALEVGSVIQKAIDAVLMDCSLYAVVVIAGISFMR